jgi:murein DD-endopeptidase MepM/ murein hydrolase activator NlpD
MQNKKKKKKKKMTKQWRNLDFLSDLKHVLALNVLAIVLACTGSVAQASCANGWLQFEEKKSDGEISISARNESSVPLTFTFDLDKRRLDASRNTTFTETLFASESRHLITLSRSSEIQTGSYRYDVDCTIGDRNADHNDSMMYLMPYASGKSYRVLQGYGSRFSHTGLEQYSVDFQMVEGTPVHAARSGVVATIEESHSRGCWEDGCGRFANYIVILHDDDTTGEYYHLQQNGALVSPGDYVTAGDVIGLSGNTGHTTMPHLHFGVYRAHTWGREQSIPVRFLTADGIIDRPRRGGRYLATPPERVSKNGDVVEIQRKSTEQL